jgi:hypothetical protein
VTTRAISLRHSSGSSSQDVCEGRSDASGVSAGWSFEDGWLPGYPETTGYIIEAFIDAAETLERPDLIGRLTPDRSWYTAATSRSLPSVFRVCPGLCNSLSWTPRDGAIRAAVEMALQIDLHNRAAAISRL